MSAVAQPNPESLIRLAKGGDQDALGDLLRTYRDYLKLLARLGIDRRVLQKADASDTVQEVFLQVQRHFDQFQGQSESELLSWLRQILASCLAKTARRYLGTQRRQVALERDLQDQLDHVSRIIGSGLATMSTPSAIAERREEGLQLANGLARLSANHREAPQIQMRQPRLDTHSSSSTGAESRPRAPSRWPASTIGTPAASTRPAK